MDTESCQDTLDFTLSGSLMAQESITLASNRLPLSSLDITVEETNGGDF